MHNERLVTLLGPGGIGKTSVALTVAERISNQFELTIFVGLDEVTGEDDVLTAFSQALRLPSRTMDAVAMALSNRSALIVVDNCEHVVEATAEVVEQLLRVSPHCRILATSREGLGVAGENIVVVPGLDTNDVTGAAVELFRKRVRLATPRSSSDPTTSTLRPRSAWRSTGCPLRSSWPPHGSRQRCPRPNSSSGSPRCSTCSRVAEGVDPATGRKH